MKLPLKSLGGGDIVDNNGDWQGYANPAEVEKLVHYINNFRPMLDMLKYTMMCLHERKHPLDLGNMIKMIIEDAETSL